MQKRSDLKESEEGSDKTPENGEWKNFVRRWDCEKYS